MMRTRRCGVDLRKLAEDQIVMFGRDADTAIAHLDEQLGKIASSARLRLEPAAAACRCEVDGVAEQIADDVRHLLAIGDDWWDRGLDLDLKVETLASQERLVERRHLVQHV